VSSFFLAMGANITRVLIPNFIPQFFIVNIFPYVSINGDNFPIYHFDESLRNKFVSEFMIFNTDE
jgi:hypothetical protein